MKKTFIILSLLIGLTFIAQAQLNIGLPQTLTYSNTPDSIKASLFSTDGTAMPFDSLYITTGAPWTETVNFYHSSRGADISTGLNASYVFTGTPTTANAVGKRPKADGTRGPKCDFNDLNTFETTDDGFLRDNKRTETATLHYGWHVIKRIRNYTYTVTISSSITRSGFLSKTYKYTQGTAKNYEDEHTEVYNYDSTVGSTTPNNNTIPPNTNNSPSTEAWHKELDDIETWTPNVTNDNAGTLYEEKKGGLINGTYNFTQQKISNKIITDYIYIWATKEEIESGTFTLPATNAEIEELINRSTTNTTGYTFNVTQNATLYDIVGQVRHHFTVGTPNSANYGTCHYNYYDTTWYDLNYSYNGQRYNTSNPNASYHEYDTKYETTGKITKIVNGESKSEYYSTIINKKPAVAMLVYAKNGNEFQYVRTANPRTQRAGRITDKKIYIRAYVNDLHWNSGDYLGWMQPVNCDIYLDNVRLRTANDTTTNHLFNETLAVDYPNVKSYNFETKNPLLASVFVLPEGNTTIHTKGDNYLAGSMGQRIHIKLKVVVSAFGTADLLTRIVETYMPNYSAPIAIKGAHLFDNNTQPNISCTFDAQWADNTNTNGYIDLSTRICQHPDSTKNKGTTNDYKVTPSSTSSSKLEAVVKWTTHKGYRYAAPLNTGGPNGTFRINGGRINLWPANGHAAQVELNSYGSKMGMEIYISIHGGKYSNYLVCGNSQWSLLCDGNTFVRTDESQIYATDGNPIPNTKLPLNIDIATLMKDYPSTATLYGAGNGIPEGHLIINGGTISANTDTKSFAYKWIDYDMTTKKSTEKTSDNVADDESGQPLFGPNVEINGGTFLHPLYGTANQGTGSALHKASYNRDELNPISQWNNNGILDYVATDYKAKNLHAQSVSRAAYALPEANTDYTTFNEINTTTEPEAHNPSAEEGKKAVIGNVGTAQEYLYGMTNVWSDEKALGYFYLPSGNNVFMQNYYVQNGETVSTFDLTQSSVTTPYHPYHLWIDKGGEISVAEDYTVHGRPFYRSGFQEGYYHTIAMPFTVDQFSVLDPDADYKEVTFTSWVDSKDAAGADNGNAYFYLYFLDDGTGAQRTTGVNEDFRKNYHTHTDGTSMVKGKTYIIKFLESDGYWEENPTIFRGAKNQTVKGKASFTFAEPPAKDLEFVMDGNTTFATQDISGKGEVYLVDPAQWGNDSFHATTVSTLAPMQGYLVGSANTMQRYRIIGREGKVEQTALDQLIHTGWTAVGAHQAMLIMTPQDATAHIYTAEGKLWKTISLTANTGVVVNAPAGFYIVHTGNESKKVLVH